MINRIKKSSTARCLLVVLTLAVASFTVTRAQVPHIYDFLGYDASARASAMGGSFMTVTNDPAAMYYNPATLYTVEKSQASFTFFKHLLDINSGFATYTTSTEGLGNWGFGVNYSDFGTFDRTDKNGQKNGQFGANDIALTVGWASELGEGLSAGLSGKFITSKIESQSSSALALDGGLLYVDTTRRVQIGISILNLGSQLSSYDQTSEPLPVDLKIGISHQLKGLPLLLSLNFSRLLDQTDKFADRFKWFSIGGEFKISQPLRLRFGFDNRVRDNVPSGQSKGLSGLAAGIGVVVKDYRFDYGFNSLAPLGGNHRITVNAIF